MRGDPRAAARQVSGLVRASRRAARVYGVGSLRTARIARRLRRRQGFEYDEAMRLGLLDPAIPAAERDQYVSLHACHGAVGALNHGGELPMLSADKAVFYRYCAALGIPTPELFAIIDRRGWSWSPLTGVFHGREGFEDLLARAPGDLVVKPSVGGLGEGLRVLLRDESGLARFDGRRTTAGELWDELAADPEYDEWIVQARLHNHPGLVALGGDRSLHGVRVATIVERGGGVDLLFAFLKLSVAGSPSDNFLSGATGNGVAVVRPADGVLGELMLPVPAPGLGFRHTAVSPSTGVPLAGTTVPLWDEIRRLVLDAAPRFLPTRALGWDVAVTPDGPVLLEANTPWLVLPLPSMRPVYERVVREGA